ncbi:hypothetical protein BLOT_008346 [Blomia tropicalis]|nr:hypothetical protein BLOT_008346 [Blomia tropicalis]
MPYRRVVQEVKPVIEEVHTVIAKNSGKGAPAYSGNSAANVNAGDGNAQYEPKYDNNMINGGETRQIPRKLKYIQERQQTSSSENNETIMLPRNVVQRSKVFISKQGIPIYQSNYMGPALLHS